MLLRDGAERTPRDVCSGGGEEREIKRDTSYERRDCDTKRRNDSKRRRTDRAN